MLSWDFAGVYYDYTPASVFPNCVPAVEMPLGCLVLLPWGIIVAVEGQLLGLSPYPHLDNCIVLLEIDKRLEKEVVDKPDVFTRAKVQYVDVDSITSRKGDVYTLVALKADGIGLIKCFVPDSVDIPDDLVIGDPLIASFELRTDARLSLGLALCGLDRDVSAVA